MSQTKTPSQIYDAILNGDALTDADCSEGLRHFESLADLLSRSGPEFRQAFRAANQAAQSLDGFISARAEKQRST